MAYPYQSLAYRHGLRASEICGVRLDHVDLKAGNIRCERGKGSVSNWQSLARDELPFAAAPRVFHVEQGVLQEGRRGA